MCEFCLYGRQCKAAHNSTEKAPAAVAALQNDVAELKGHLAARDRSGIVRWGHFQHFSFSETKPHL